MKTNTFHAKKVLVALFTVLRPLLTSAYDFEIDGIYYNITSLQDLTVEVTSGDSKYIEDIVIPPSVEYSNRTFSVTKLGDSAFKNSQITSISIPNTVTAAGTYVFSGCSKLTSITIPSSMTIFENGCFKSCYNLSHVVIEDSNTTLSLYFNEWQVNNSSYFTNCNIKSVYLGRNVRVRTGEDYDGLFWNQTALEKVVIGDSVTEIGWQEFVKCTSLNRIVIPSNVKHINTNAFYGCTGLKYLILNEGLEKISNGAFKDCLSINSLIIPSSVTSIGDEAFVGCTGLKKVYSKITTPMPLKEQTFAGITYLNATLYVPIGTKSLYESATGWENFSTIIEIENFDNIKDFISDITLNKTSTSLTEGDTLSLSAIVTPDEAEDKSLNWSSSNPSVATVDNAGKVTAIAPGTATITVTANDGSGVSAQCEVTVTPASYVITYLIDGEQFFVETLTRGSAITLPEVPTKEGYTFSGWGEVPETMPAKDVTISGTFIANKYLVTFKIDDEVIIADSLEYGTAIVAPEAPEKEGYTFSGWGEVAGNVPAYDLTYKGSYSINSYTLTYVVDGEAVLTLPVVYGATIPSLKAPEKEGYTFSGWSEAPAVMPAKDVTIEGTFTQLPSIYLTINQADNGCVKQHLVVGIVCAYTIEAAEGWKIHSVTFNGEDVTSQLTEEGTFTTPELQDDATLNIAYEKIDDGIAGATKNRIKVQGHQGTISIAGATEGEAIGLYTTNGTLVATATAEGDTTQLTVPTGQVYIVKVADTVVKIGM